MMMVRMERIPWDAAAFRQRRHRLPAWLNTTADIVEKGGALVMRAFPNPLYMILVPVGVLGPAAGASTAAVTVATGGYPATDRIRTAMNPLIDLVQGVSYPVCMLMLSGGFLLIMVGRKDQGLNMIKWAAIGFIGLQFVPGLMNILAEVGRAVWEAQQPGTPYPHAPAPQPTSGGM